MNKKILGILLILIAAVAIGTVVAAETVEIDGYKFNIPDGFKENTNLESVDKEMEADGVKYVYNSKVYENSAGDAVNLLVAQYDMEITNEILESMGGEALTISGIDGYLLENETMFTFEFEHEGKAVILTSNNKDLFEQFLIEEE